MQTHPVAVRYALPGARILSGTLTSGDPPLERVAGELKESVMAAVTRIRKSSRNHERNTPFLSEHAQ